MYQKIQVEGMHINLCEFHILADNLTLFNLKSRAHIISCSGVFAVPK
jgi:hypothetical protein